MKLPEFIAISTLDTLYGIMTSGLVQEAAKMCIWKVHARKGCGVDCTYRVGQK